MLHWSQKDFWPGNIRELQHIIERAVIFEPAVAVSMTHGSFANVYRYSRCRMIGFAPRARTLNHFE
ncbi:MAG: hypothetical protein JWO48_3064 [Bryobacterales bacterium]|nr:hypothetical protein [Bryobacterales bacterium]